MTTNQRSRGGAVMFAYEMWKERNIHPQTCLHFDKCIKQGIKCIGEQNNRKYRSYQASIDPIPIPTLVSILSIFGSIRPPLKNSECQRWHRGSRADVWLTVFYFDKVPTGCQVSNAGTDVCVRVCACVRSGVITSTVSLYQQNPL